MQRSLLSALGVLVVVASASHARGETLEEQKYSVWQSDEHTLFVSSASDAGLVYARAHATLGYGAPFWNFVGVDAWLIATVEFTAAYAGWRANLPFLDAQMGVRSTQPFSRRRPPAQESHTRSDLQLGEGESSLGYNAIELEVSPLAPVGGGVVFAELHPIWIDAPKDRHVFDEVTRVVVAPPFVLRTRLGYLYDLGRVKLGGMVEHMVLPGRPQDVTRLGPVCLVAISGQLEGLFTTTVVVRSPDTLGPYLGSYGFLGLRMRFAERF